MNHLKVLTTCDIIVPSITLAVVSDFIKDTSLLLNLNKLFVDKHSNMILIPTLNIMSTNGIPCVLINLSTKYIHIVKGKMLGFLKEIDIERGKLPG